MTARISLPVDPWVMKLIRKQQKNIP